MISSKTLKIAGAAILGTLVGTSSAYAQITAGTGVDGTISNKLVVAKESLLSTATTMVDGTPYYNLTGVDQVELRFPVGTTLATTGETLRVTITLTNMVFQDSVLLQAKASAATTEAWGTTTNNRFSANVSPVAGGTAKATTATFVLSAPSAALVAGDYFVIRPGSGLAIAAEGNGSIQIESEKSAGFTYPAGTNRTLTNVVTIAEGVNDRITEVRNAQADVAEGYMRFVPYSGSGDSNIHDNERKAWVGHITLGVTPTPANSTFRTTSGGVPTLTTRNTTLGTTRLGFTGDVSFAKSANDVFLSNSSTCSTEDFGLLAREGDTGPFDWKTGDARAEYGDADNASGVYFCIKVDGETAIPETSFQVSLAYTGISNAAFPPEGQNFSLGRITRSGTAVHIPYFTTAAGFKHLLVMTNRGSSAVPYRMTFETENGDRATGAAGASGMLATGVTTIPADELVEISGTPRRTAITITVDAAEADIGIATVLVNMDDNYSTDTVVFTE